MNQVTTLLTPRIRSFKNKGRSNRHWVKTGLFAAAGGLLWAGLFAVSFRVLHYIKGIEDIGDLLAFKLLSMALLTFFSLLIFSSLLTSLSKLFLSKDLNLVHALPIAAEKIFLARWIESTADSSWMVLVYSIPILISYGIAFRAGLFFYVYMAFSIFPMCIVASGIAAVAVMTVVMILPAGRVKSIFVFLGISVFIVLYIAFRLLKPEQLVDPETFASTLLYIQSLNTPSSPLLPSTWLYDGLRAALKNDIPGSLFHAAISVSGAAFMGFLAVFAARILYFKGYSKSQASMMKLFKTEKDRLSRLFSFLSGPTRAFLVKEIRTFWRDQTQWSQIFLIGALVIIYLYNFSVLPLEKSPIQTIYLQNLFSFLNMGLAAFVLTAVAARFVFPCVSIEGSAFWLVKSGPISIRSFLLIKFFIYLLPLLVLSQLLIVASNILLRVSPLMMGLSVVTLLFLAPGVVAIGIGLGAAYPDFSSENPAQSATSFGGLIFMLFSTALIASVILIEAGPVYILLMAKLKGISPTRLQWAGIILSFAVDGIICLLTIYFFFTFGKKRLSIHPLLQSPSAQLSEKEEMTPDHHTEIS
jgi:ABC-2 type transport system permease protein